ncbi:MAG: TonB family protein [Deltaproteobacteria bacterium]|nr:TonB family protein [Deltaproteobacteria bacterium]
MAVDRFELLDRLFQQAVVLDSTERTGFLELACAGDEALRSEVEALIEADSEAADFIEQAVVGGSQLLRSKKDPLASIGRVGKYEILDVIGEGGFGIVYKGRDTVLQRYVAIKVCTSNNPELRQRFVREAEIAAGLQHPNITTLHDLGQEGDWSYLVQELLGGEDLEAKIGRREPMSLERRLDLLLQVARGLGYAHEHGVLHRDVKPANVRVLANGRVKIMDFGIARWLGEETGLTQDGQSLGTVGYLSPEQLRNEEPDQRADLFAFGVLAYELLSYEKPFVGDSFSQVSYQVLYERPRPLGQVWNECPAVVEQIVHRCLEKNPRKRFASLAEVVAALEPLVEGLRSGSTVLSEKFLSRSLGGRWASWGPWSHPGTRVAAGGIVVTAVAVATWLGVVSSNSSGLSGPPAEALGGVERPTSLAFSRRAPGDGLDRTPSSSEADSLSARTSAEDPGNGKRARTLGSGLEASGPASTLPASSSHAQGPLTPGTTLEGETSSELELEFPRKPGLSENSVPSAEVALRTAPTGEPQGSSQAGLLDSVDPGRTVPEMGPGDGSSLTSPGAGGALVEAEPRLSAPPKNPGSGSSGAEVPPEEFLESPGSEPDPSVVAEVPGGSSDPENSATVISATVISSTGGSGDSVESPPRQDLLSEGPGVVKPGLLERPNPVYPEKARRRHREALVVVAVLVDGGGRVEHALIKRGDDSGLGFNEAAITAARSARFHPATENGVAGRMWTEIRFDFLLQ